jgi:hypothetical protein
VADKNIVVLQNTLDFVKDEHHSDSEMFPTCHDKLIHGRIQEDSLKEEENPSLTQFPEVKSECEVCTYAQC